MSDKSVNYCRMSIKWFQSLLDMQILHRIYIVSIVVNVVVFS